ncbi:MAG: hypothetical protein H6502_01425 [Candidatus Woesearchaeota archaeon]|nr:MAG: hypothetical protein H6502_01425 [Candidatus Woesearchaeota archaeon]
MHSHDPIAEYIIAASVIAARKKHVPTTHLGNLYLIRQQRSPGEISILSIEEIEEWASKITPKELQKARADLPSQVRNVLNHLEAPESKRPEADYLVFENKIYVRSGDSALYGHTTPEEILGDTILAIDPLAASVQGSIWAGFYHSPSDQIHVNNQAHELQAALLTKGINANQQLAALPLEKVIATLRLTTILHEFGERAIRRNFPHFLSAEQKANLLADPEAKEALADQFIFYALRKDPDQASHYKIIHESTRNSISLAGRLLHEASVAENPYATHQQLIREQAKET